jgi:phage terminase large subunit GpA-like protein
MTSDAIPVPAWAAGWAPPPALTVSEWADLHRVLPESSAARGARWRNSTAPYLPGIMDVVHEPTTRKAAIMTASQVGKSESINNILGYCMEHDPCPMLLVHPTALVAEAYSKERLSDMIRTTPALRAIVQEKRVAGVDGRPESTMALKMFPGGFLALGGANTPNTFARWSVRLAIGDDVDRFPPVVGEEGDPGELLVNRTTTFHDRLAIFVSTPTIKGGRIDALWERSDKRRYHVRCPACGRLDWITWNDPSHFRVVFDERDPQTARIECPDDEHGGCGCRIREPERGALVASGEWRPTREEKDGPGEAGLVGFHVPAMLSPWVTLQELVEKFLVARAAGRESLKVFINTALGEPWEDRSVRMEAHQLLSRLEDYGILADETPVDVPLAAAALTAGVDVQQDGFRLLVLAWGPAGERWVVDWRIIPATTTTSPWSEETNAALLEGLTRRYQHASGVLLPIHANCIDSGYAATQVYDFVLRYQARRIFATKSLSETHNKPLVGAPSKTKAGRSPRPIDVYPVNSDEAKAGVLASIALAGPGPNATHFPARVPTVDPEFFAQLCSEHRETRYSKGGVATHMVWVQDREQNHAFDAMVLAYVAFLLLRPNLRDMAARIAEAAAKAASNEAQPAPPAQPLPPPAPPARPATQTQARRRYSSYLQRNGGEG